MPLSEADGVPLSSSSFRTACSGVCGREAEPDDTQDPRSCPSLLFCGTWSATPSCAVSTSLSSLTLGITFRGQPPALTSARLHVGPSDSPWLRLYSRLARAWPPQLLFLASRTRSGWRLSRERGCWCPLSPQCPLQGSVETKCSE